MPRGLRIAALFALFGLGSVTVGSAAALSLTCCSRICESCPASFGKGSDADKTPKTVIPGPAAGAASMALDGPIERFEPFARPEPRVVASGFGFVRPMRR